MGKFSSATPPIPSPRPSTTTTTHAGRRPIVYTCDDECVLCVRRKVISAPPAIRIIIYIGRDKCITYEVYCELLLVFIQLKTICKNSADAILSL